MSVNIESILLFIKLLAKGYKVSREIAAIAKRLENGETIGDEELNAALGKVQAAVDKWDNLDHKPDPEPPDHHDHREG